MVEEKALTQSQIDERVRVIERAYNIIQDEEEEPEMKLKEFGRTEEDLKLIKELMVY